jgi:uncharacterized protein (TIGR02453 family)
MSSTKAILQFLSKLKANNSREWMQDNKNEYLKQKLAFSEIVQSTINGILEFDQTLVGVEPKDCMFRINRDIRFSKDKTLYKTHFGAYMAKGGRKSMLPGYYLHLESGNKSMLAAGLYRPASNLLNKVRQEIDYNGKALTSIVESDQWKHEFSALQGEKLTKAPKGYTMDHPLIDYLQRKSFLAVFQVKDAEAVDEAFGQKAIQVFSRMQPLVKFLNTAVS